MKKLIIILSIFLTQLKPGTAQQTPEWRYNNLEVYSTTTEIAGIICDSKNNVIVASHFEPYGKEEEPYGFCITKYSPDGEILWTDTAFAGFRSQVKGIALDEDDNIYIAAYYIKKIEIQNYLFEKNDVRADLLLIRFDSSGKVIWITKEKESFPSDIFVYNNMIFIGGFSAFTQTLGCGIHNGNFIAKYDTAGNCDFVISPNYKSANNITGDTLGNIYVQTGDVISQRRLEKYDSSLNLLWTIQIPSYVSDVKSDKNGDIYILGGFYGGASFGNHSLSSYYSNSGQSYIAKLNTNGEWEWAIKPVSDSIKFGCFDIGETGIGIAGFVGDAENSTKDLGLFFGKFHKSNGEMAYRRKLADNLFLKVAAMDKDENLFVGGDIYNKAIEYLDGMNLAKFKTEKIISSSIEKNRFQGNYQIYPNPAPKEFTIDYSNPYSGKVKINVLNHIGQNVFSKEVFSYSGCHKEVINLAGAAPGVYFVTIQIGDAVERSKIVIE
jgi:hypothetical protein